MNIKGWKNRSDSLGVPIFISEFGACMNDAACLQELTMASDICERELVGWSYWQFKTYKDFTTIAGTDPEGYYLYDGTPKDIMLKPLTRPYV